MSFLFLETSALLRALFDEEQAGVVRRRVNGAQRIFASRLLKLEAERAVLRFVLDYPDNAADQEELGSRLAELWPRVDFFEVSEHVCNRAGALFPRSRLRSLDAIHVATYLLAREVVANLEMLTFDERIQKVLGK